MRSIVILVSCLLLAGCGARAWQFEERERLQLDELLGLDEQILENRTAQLVAMRWGEMRRGRLELLRAQISALEDRPRPIGRRIIVQRVCCDAGVPRQRPRPGA